MKDMKINIKFDMEDESDKYQYDVMMASSDVRSMLYEIDNKLRILRKYYDGVRYVYGSNEVKGVEDLASMIQSDICEAISGEW